MCCTKVHCRPEIVVNILQDVRKVTVNLTFYSYIYSNTRLYLFIYLFHHTCILWIPVNLWGNPVGQPRHLWHPPSHLWCSIGEGIGNGGAKFSVGFITTPYHFVFHYSPQAEMQSPPDSSSDSWAIFYAPKHSAANAPQWNTCSYLPVLTPQ